MKNKKLGVLHIISTYIWLPCVILGYIYELLNLCVFLFSDIESNFTIDIVPYAMITAAVVFLAVITFISMIQQNNIASLSLKYFLVIYNADFFLRGIIAIQDEYTSLLSLPVCMIIPVVTTILLLRYYNKRNYLLDNSRMGYVIANSPNIIYTYLAICVTILAIIIEVYSIFFMFQSSIGEGFFGVCVPVIAQIVFLFQTGFTSAYANTIYGMLIIFACIYIMAYMDENF